MLKYSHIALIIPLLKGDSTGELITQHLGISPTRIVESKSHVNNGDDTFREELSYYWYLDSPRNEDFEPVNRLHALMELIRPFIGNIQSLGSDYSKWIDMIFHVTPQYPHGITGEFNWFRLPSSIMKELGEWNIDLSHEVFWFDHPDWTKPKQNFFKKLFRK